MAKSETDQNQLRAAESENSGWKNLYKVCSASSLILGVLLFSGAVFFILAIIWNGTNDSWFSPLQRNWLIVIFKLHAGLITIQGDPLHGLNFLDIFILVLFTAVSSGLTIALKKAGRIWSILAFVLSLLAILLFIATQIAGRSTVMLSVLIYSFVMLRSNIFSKLTIYLGILASVFLFAGDLTVGIHSNFITFFFWRWIRSIDNLVLFNRPNIILFGESSKILH